MSQLLASRSPVPSSEVQIRDPTWRKVYLQATKPEHAEPRLRYSAARKHFNPYSARQMQRCLQWEQSSCIPAQPSRPVNFGRPHPKLCVLAALPAHQRTSTLVCSSLLLLQLLVTYALVRRKASSGMQRTCSARASQSLGPI
jgi:hypothetical protein